MKARERENNVAFSMYSASLPALKSMLANLSQCLHKAQLHAQAKKFDPAILLNARLYPDMFALTRQVQVATDQALSAAARLAGQEPPKLANSETTIEQLQRRIETTIAYLDAVQPQQLEGSEERTIVVRIVGQYYEFTGREFLVNEVLPNFYFHVTAAYAILRHNGVELGKPDFLGGIVMRNQAA